MGDSIQLGAIWHNEEKGTSWGRIKREELEEALELVGEDEDISFSVFENQFKESDNQPDFNVVVFKESRNKKSGYSGKKSYGNKKSGNSARRSGGRKRKKSSLF